MKVVWEPPPSIQANGEITGYKIYYIKDINRDDSTASIEQITDPAQTSFVIDSLEVWTKYRIWMKASTSIGDSPPSQPVVARTGETGEFCLWVVLQASLQIWPWLILKVYLSYPRQKLLDFSFIVNMHCFLHCLCYTWQFLTLAKSSSTGRPQLINVIYSSPSLFIYNILLKALLCQPINGNAANYCCNHLNVAYLNIIFNIFSLCTTCCF